jgi:hypothetical protein
MAASPPRSPPPLAPSLIKQSIDAAGIGRESRGEFLASLQAFITGDADSLAAPSDPSEVHAWAAAFGYLSGHLNSTGLSAQVSRDTVQDIPEDFDAQDDDELVKVNLTKKQYDVWTDLKKSLEPEPESAPLEEEQSSHGEEDESSIAPNASISIPSAASAENVEEDSPEANPEEDEPEAASERDQSLVEPEEDQPAAPEEDVEEAPSLPPMDDDFVIDDIV